MNFPPKMLEPQFAQISGVGAFVAFGVTCLSVSPAAVLPVLKEERKKRRSYEESGGPGPKRRRTPAEELRYPITYYRSSAA
eukprot:s5131_g2.t1